MKERILKLSLVTGFTINLLYLCSNYNYGGFIQNLSLGLTVGLSILGGSKIYNLIDSQSTEDKK